MYISSVYDNVTIMSVTLTQESFISISIVQSGHPNHKKCNHGDESSNASPGARYALSVLLQLLLRYVLIIKTRVPLCNIELTPNISCQKVLAHSAVKLKIGLKKKHAT